MTELVLTMIVAIAGSSAVSAVVVGLFGRRKIGAEASEIVTRAAGDQLLRMQGEIADLRSEITDLRAENDDLERKVERIERREMQHRDMLMTHAAWDFRVMRVLQRVLTPEQMEAEDIRPAPPLYPPH